MSYPVIDIKRGLRTYLDVRNKKTGEKRRVAFHRWPKGKPFGLLIHTTGPGMEKYARVHQLSQVDTVAKVYGNPGMTCAHVVVLPDGTRIRCVSDYLVAPHCGVDGWQRTALLNGTWRAWTSDAAEAEWSKRWPDVKSPQHLFPTASGNDSFKGLETWKLPARDPQTGSYYTAAQYESTAEWIVEQERELGIIAGGRRLVTHEDLDPFERWDEAGGRDPGVIRPDPFYDWPLLLSCIDVERAKAAGSKAA